jgi:hypothetical protein
MWIVGVTVLLTIFMLAASAGSALAAAGQRLCIGAAGRPVTAPNSHGNCKKGQKVVTLATQSEIATLQRQITALNGQRAGATSPSTTPSGQVSALQSQVAGLQSDDATLKGQVAGLQSDNATLKSEVSTLQSTLSNVSYDPHGLNGLPTLTVSGANLQIVNGWGTTDGSVNGLGNLIIGYDEHPQTRAQTGSHNLILGEDQRFTSYGGLIGGYANTLTGPFSAVLGSDNFAQALGSTVTGGINNVASGTAATVSGGVNNGASGDDSSVSGGNRNLAGDESSVTGGYGNTASGWESSVTGGYDNKASGYFSSVLGGYNITVNTTYGHNP